jgi:hypothetical protein
VRYDPQSTESLSLLALILMQFSRDQDWMVKKESPNNIAFCDSLAQQYVPDITLRTN